MVKMVKYGSASRAPRTEKRGIFVNLYKNEFFYHNSLCNMPIAFSQNVCYNMYVIRKRG